MYNTTGLAVGLAIGVPVLMVGAVIAAFWYRQSVKYKNDVKEHPEMEDYDEMNDLDLDNIIDSPKQPKKDVEDSSETGNENESGFVLRSGTYSVKKGSKIMGLKMVTQEERDSYIKKTPSQRKSLLNQSSTEKLTSDYKTYYESMIPVLPTAEGSAASLANLSTDDFNPMKTPIKTGSLTSTTQESLNNQRPGLGPGSGPGPGLGPGSGPGPGSVSRKLSQSNTQGLYKILQDDSPMYPKSRIGSNVNQMIQTAEIQKISPSKANGQATDLDFFETPTKIAQKYISPFDSPPSVKGLHLDETDDSSTNERIQEEEIEGDLSQNNISKVVSSASKSNLHRRLNSVESNIMVDEDTAEESHDLKRREWLDSLKKH